jgi:hypothetical protein
MRTPVVVAAGFARSAAKSPGTLSWGGDLGHLEGDLAAVANECRTDLE